MSLIEGPVPLYTYLRMADNNKSVPLNGLTEHSNHFYTNHESHEKARRMYSEVASIVPNTIFCKKKPDTPNSDSVSPDPMMPAVKPRKSSFQITRVVDSVEDTDGFDEIDGIGSEDRMEEDAIKYDCAVVAKLSSGLESGQQLNVIVNGHCDMYNHANSNANKAPSNKIDPDVPSSIPCSELLKNSSPQQKEKALTSAPACDIQSRFKIVKIISHLRGRWKCLDFSGHCAAESTNDSKSDKTLGSPPIINGVNSPSSFLYVADGVNAATNPLQNLVCGGEARLVKLGSDPNFQKISEVVATNMAILPAANNHDTRNSSNISNSSLSSTNIFAHGGNILPSMSLTIPLGSASIDVVYKPVISENSSTYNRTRSDPSFQTAVSTTAGVISPIGNIENQDGLICATGSTNSLEDANIGGVGEAYRNGSGGVSNIDHGTANGVINNFSVGEGINSRNGGVNMNGADAGIDVVNNLEAVVGDPVKQEESTSGICPLDNKIEQAMDLVKSHLMFAVHEEVEQLKVQIKELALRNVRLELENSILRAAALPETLAKLDKLSPSNGRTDFT